MPGSSVIGELLRKVREGDQQALAQLLPVVYDELRAIAARYLQRERAGHTLQTTALVHEVFIKLVGQTEARWQNRAQFFAVAAQAMRRILVDYARGHQAAKRGGGKKAVSLDDVSTVFETDSADVIAIDQALQKLAELDPLQSRIVELRFFAGMTNEEVAQALGHSLSTIKREWGLARAWLHRELQHL
ncbi:MAG: hypothetical protein HJJLKODD_02147 [Phycisphaerae bacterium]|nr:hypothetical protein [Phycisphaerae bacterium]